MRKVIVNSTPIIVLCNVGKLEILRTLYTEITIPEAVFAEVTKKEDIQEGVQADLVILDDNAAKKTAKYLGLTVFGGSWPRLWKHKSKCIRK